MRKIIYIVITFIACYILNLERVWLGFISAYLIVSMFETDRNFLWEIPLATMLCDVLLVAFSDDIRMLVYVLSIVSTVLISSTSTRRLFILFPLIIVSVTVENIYTVSALWAIIWYATRTILGYFTTKQFDLQEYKL